MDAGNNAAFLRAVTVERGYSGIEDVDRRRAKLRLCAGRASPNAESPRRLWIGYLRAGQNHWMAGTRHRTKSIQRPDPSARALCGCDAAHGLTRDAQPISLGTLWDTKRLFATQGGRGLHTVQSPNWINSGEQRRTHREQERLHKGCRADLHL